MANLFSRYFELTLIADENELIFRENKVEFQTILSIGQTPNHCSVRIYNLSDATANRVKEGEFSLIKIIAGYENTQGVVFFGSIKYTRSGRLDSANTYLDILGSDGDLWYNWAYLNGTIENYTVEESIDQAFKGAKFAAPTYNIGAARNSIITKLTKSNNYLEKLNLPKGIAPRGKVLYGSARDYFRRMGQNYSFNWSIQQGEISLLPFAASVSGETVVITAQTGLIGFPRVEIDGIHFKTLLNTGLFPGTLIQLNNASITGFLGSPNIAVGFEQQAIGARLAEDGKYKCLLATHHGDTRGNNWYSDVICYDWNDVPKVRNANLQIQGAAGVYNNPPATK